MCLRQKMLRRARVSIATKCRTIVIFRENFQNEPSSPRRSPLSDPVAGPFRVATSVHPVTNSGTTDRITGARIIVEALRCRYGKMIAVDDVSFCVSPGEHVAITGANGSGKSSVLRTIVGLHRGFHGAISIDGHTVPSVATGRLCAWVPQRQVTGSFPLHVRELLGSSADPGAAISYAERLGLGELMRRPVSELSGGQLQRAFISRALGSLEHGAKVLVADEPTASLDFDGQREVAAIIKGLDATVIVATHDQALASMCDRHLEMAAGHLRESL